MKLPGIQYQESLKFFKIMTLKIDNSGLGSILKNHLDKKTKQLTEGLKASLDSPVFSWGSQTHRKNGEVVSDPRNAVDTGELQKSIQMKEDKGLSNKIYFEAEYSARVLEHSSVDFVEFTIGRIGDD